MVRHSGRVLRNRPKAQAHLGDAAGLGFGKHSSFSVGLPARSPTVKAWDRYARRCRAAQPRRTYLSLATSPSIITRKNQETLSLNDHEQTLDYVFKSEN